MLFEDFRLKVFLAVCEKGSFTDAAHKLGVTQPAVSQNVAELEKLLGVQLFERKRGSVTPTDKGILFKGYAEQILHWYQAAQEAFASGGTPPEVQTVDLGDGRAAELWSSQGDLHIHFKN